ncbi:Rpn family recombination-promoting nuclease/putative transposase [uncultured Sphingobacterium sp.]|uniref:Rpn family recombination-promoting nuclease/putative transposase n=1 Tax=uncultured Sphingobacterium sp. TaxID=182688 RepID=UPI0025E919DC|nr:Rpn family recombination-promoting nuclease/putative transposase [uncultured Sphingobacterium sp.]
MSELKQSKYIDITTDYGFKKVFGSDTNKDLLIAFLNELFRGRKVIADLYYNKNEHVGDTADIGTVIFDLTCTADNGERFIIEVQRTSQVNLKKRMLYYSSKLISDQAPKGNRRAWNYAISEVYIIVLMDGFAMPDAGEEKYFLHDICLCYRDHGKIFYDDLGFIYIELVNFVKAEAELVNDLDRWLYVLKNMSSLNGLSTYLRKPIFEKLFQLAEYSKLKPEEREMYNVSLRNKWDAESIRSSQEEQLRRAREKAMAEGRAEGIAEGEAKGKAEGEVMGKAEVIKNLLSSNKFSISEIAELAEVTVEFVKQIEAEKPKGK